MPSLVLGTVTNYQTEELARASASFERLIDAYKEELAALAQTPSDLATVFVRFEFGCQGLPGAAVGTKVGRLSPASNSVQASIGVNAAEYASAPPPQQFALIAQPLMGLLKLIHQRYDKRIQTGIPILLQSLLVVNARFANQLQ